MKKIEWTGRNTNKNQKWEVTAESMISLYNKLTEKGIISTEDKDPWEEAVLKKAGKDINSDEFLDEDGYINPELIQKAIDEAEDLTDKELWELIKDQDGNAYYQSFLVNDEEITEEDFNEKGELK